MKYFVKIFGCQMNYSDAERISTILEKYKLKPAASIDAADLIVFVTCGVRQSAEDRVYGQIHNLRKKYPKKKIILTGCLAHRKDVQRRLKGKVDLFFPISNPIPLISLISPKKIKKSLALSNDGSLAPVREKPSFDMKGDYLKITPRYTNHYTAYIPIMTGCNNFCSYCVVPYARGREYSRPAEDILKEVKNIVKKGYKEIILLGQNVNSYKSDLNIKNSEIKKLFQHSKFPQKARLATGDKIKNSDTINFASLLKIIDIIPGNFWLTFLTSHPKDMSDELIETIANSKKICAYVSLPAQSGDDEILRKMNRKYTIEHYKKLIKEIRKEFLETKSPFGDLVSNLPPAISTDIIVGFPGETKKQFENTAKLLREMKFDMAYVSQYSPRPGSAAWKVKDNVSKKEKERRDKVLTEILKKTALENNKKYIGKFVEVLVDKRLSPHLGTKSPSKTKYIAHTRTQKRVIFFSNKKIPIGNFAKVKIIKAKTFGLEGEIL
jgi:tRNA-2-methylthio-N6-dimethylallyladenosine synthase